jgi:hypothetical protein
MKRRAVAIGFAASAVSTGRVRDFFVADSSPQQKQMFEESGCPVKEVVGHIVRTLEISGVAERIASRAASLEENP